MFHIDSFQLNPFEKTEKKRGKEIPLEIFYPKNLILLSIVNKKVLLMQT